MYPLLLNGVERITRSNAGALVLTALLCSTAPAKVLAQDQPGSGVGEFRGGQSTDYPAWFKDSFLEFEDDVAEAAQAGRRVLLFFTQDNCPYCHALVTRNLSQKQIEDKVRGNFDVIQINIWGDREVVSLDGRTYSEKEFARVLGIQFTPTLIFLDETGAAALRLNGYQPPHQFETALDFVSGHMEKETSYRDYLAERRPHPASDRLHAESFFMAPPHDLSATAAGNRPIAVFFEQAQCPNCDTLHERVLADQETRSVIRQFASVQLDMWSDTAIRTPAGDDTTARRWADELGVQYAPTIILFSPNGDEIIRSEAYFKIFHNQTMFNYVLSGRYRSEPSFQRYLTERADHIRAQGRDVDIWQ
jgi:thioredoxin-related protein